MFTYCLHFQIYMQVCTTVQQVQRIMHYEHVKQNTKSSHLLRPCASQRAKVDTKDQLLLRAIKVKLYSYLLVYIKYFYYVWYVTIMLVICEQVRFLTELKYLCKFYLMSYTVTFIHMCNSALPIWQGLVRVTYCYKFYKAAVNIDCSHLSQIYTCALQ